MKRVSEHLADSHQAEAAHQGELAKSKRREAKIHLAMHKTAGMTDDQDGPHAQLANECDKAADLHDAHQAKHLAAMAECRKAAADSLNKRGDELIPDHVSAVLREFPGITPVPRTGAPTIKVNVAPEFEKLYSIDE